MHPISVGMERVNGIPMEIFRLISCYSLVMCIIVKTGIEKN